MSPPIEKWLTLKVSEALGKDTGRGIARLDPADIKRLGLEIGDIIEIGCRRKTVAKVMAAFRDQRGQSRIQIDGVLRENAGASLDQMVEVKGILPRHGDRVVVAPLSGPPDEKDLDYIGSRLDGLPVLVGDRIQAALFGGRSADFKVVSTNPPGPVVIHPTTMLEIAEPKKDESVRIVPTGPRPLSYEEIGGLKRELGRIREMIELPLRYPEVFSRLGIDAPKGVLLYGPPGCGKTLIARAVAHEAKAKFYTINGPEIIHKFYGDSEGALRKVFEDATKYAPSIIFIDEIDSIAPRREKVVGDVEKRVVAQLLTLMDGLSARKQVIVIAATNLPNAIDPALRRPGRFDREIGIPVPDATSRKEILEIYMRGMPGAEKIDVDRLAADTHGFVGADLQGLCREAAMVAVRRLLPEIDFASSSLPEESLTRLVVTQADFDEARHAVEPSAVRDVFVEVPDTTWDDVGGLAGVKQQLIEAVEWPLKHPAHFAAVGVRPPKGILLSGPPGCGKTLLAKAVASQTKVNFLSVKGPALLGKYVGESEQAVREVFAKARQAAPCIIFFDEIDALTPSRGSGGTDGHVTERVIGQFLAEMDGIEELRGVLVLAATNRRDILDPALLRPGRFDVLIEIPEPDEAGRRDIFRLNLKEKPLAAGLTLDDLCQDLAAVTDHFTGAEIYGACVQAGRAAIRQALTPAAGPAGDDGAPSQNDVTTNPGAVKISRQDLDAALAEIRATR